MNPIDTYRDAFLKFLAEGMDHEEAMNQFDEEELKAAYLAELERGDCAQVRNPETMLCENACGHETLFDLVCKAQWVQRNRLDFENQAVPLMLAGWTMQDPGPVLSPHFWSQHQVMSLYWRAPSKRTGKPGRLYRSTNQAFNAMQRAAQ